MKKKIDPDMPIGKLTRVKDFLPPPEELVFPRETVKVTISLSKSSIEFFKRQARQHHIKYQKMIRELLDRYAAQYS
ncbi:CopG family transcriptional regulator [Candidatus Omnitrophota bacterium]